MNNRLFLFACAFSFVVSGLPAAEIMTGIGVNETIEDSTLSTDAVAEFSVSSTILSTTENAVYAGISGIAKFDPASSSGGGSVAADLLYSRLFGLDMAGIKIGFEAGFSDTADVDPFTALMSVPVTLNGASVSFSFTPKFEYAPATGGHVSAGADTALSFAMCELIVKPGLSFSSVRYADGARMYEFGPGFKITWYPGFPLTTELNATYRHLTDPDGIDADPVFEAGLLASVAPFEWLLLSGQADFSVLDGASPPDAFLEASFFLWRKGSKTLSVPLHFRYSSDDAAVYEIGAGLRFYF